MKIVVIGGTGLIGTKVVANLSKQGHEAVAAALNTGVNIVTGEGLADVLAGAEVLVDLSNSPSFEDAAVLTFFETSTNNLLEAEAKQGVRHHVALSVVGCDRLPDSGYLRAKVAQEQLIEKSGMPYSIVRATQFFEFVARIADEATTDGVVRLPSGGFQPIASDDVALAVTRAALDKPSNGRVEVAGPDRAGMDEFLRTALAARDDPREVVTDEHATYFGTELTEDSLVPIGPATLGEIHYADWARA